jgi:hypothetical protein
MLKLGLGWRSSLTHAGRCDGAAAWRHRDVTDPQIAAPQLVGGQTGAVNDDPTAERDRGRCCFRFNAGISESLPPVVLRAGSRPDGPASHIPLGCKRARAESGSVGPGDETAGAGAKRPPARSGHRRDVTG